MAGYGDQINGPYSYSGGSSIIPNYWADKLGKAFVTRALWSRFATPVIVDVPLMQKGAGKVAYWSHTTDIGISGAGTLTEGTTIPNGSNALLNNSATIVEFGVGVGIEGFAEWLVNPSYSPLQASAGASKQATDAMTSLTNWSVKVWDRYVGGMALTGGNNYAVRTATTGLFGLIASGTAGTAVMTPTTLADLRRNLVALGKEPIPALNDTYAMIVPPGGARWLSLTDGVQRDAASLGYGEAFQRGFIAQYGGFSFFEEQGLNGVTTFSSTSGTAVCLCADSLAADTNMGNEPNYMLYYPDVSNDAGRRKEAKVYFLGIAAPMIPGTDGTYQRVFTVNYQM